MLLLLPPRHINAGDAEPKRDQHVEAAKTDLGASLGPEQAGGGLVGHHLGVRACTVFLILA
jgi:hypothetical protein